MIDFFKNGILESMRILRIFLVLLIGVGLIVGTMFGIAALIDVHTPGWGLLFIPWFIVLVGLAHWLDTKIS